MKALDLMNERTQAAHAAGEIKSPVMRFSFTGSSTYRWCVIPFNAVAAGGNGMIDTVNRARFFRTRKQAIVGARCLGFATNRYMLGRVPD